MKDDVGAPREACFAGRPTGDAGCFDAVDKGIGGLGIVSLNRMPAGCICSKIAICHGIQNFLTMCLKLVEDSS